ncbi:hypothetical protein [Enterobacter roggenkampii]|uniref:hypothetical protein n=1 Tax=Enterobacter roggenkampii TaxID=1812935 RepID=UPI0023EC3D7E|nr:hypothetical protein [Escherichia coli]
MTLPACRSQDTDYSNLMGQEIGTGVSRKVYEVKHHPGWVLKECTVPGNGPNEQEAAVYFLAVTHQWHSLLNSLAKVHGISQSGKFLIMEKLDTQSSLEGKTCNVMKELSDLKPNNFGVDSNGNIKSLDYVTLKDTLLLTDITGDIVPHEFLTSTENNQLKGWKNLFS